MSGIRRNERRVPGGPGNSVHRESEQDSGWDPDPDDVVGGPDLGDLVVLLLGATLAAMADQLASDGFDQAAELVSDLLAAVDDYTASLS